MERTMKVTGKGKIAAKPDTIRLVITETGMKKEYAETIKESARMKQELNEVLESVGLKKSDLKTLSFDIDTAYESYQEKGAWKRKMVGYTFTHRMKVEFPLNNEFLGKVLGAVADCVGKPEFSILFTVADPEPVKNELLAKAIEDSRNKAKIMAAAAGVSLGQIVNVDYSWGEVEMVSRFMDFGAEPLDARACSAVDIDVEPDDIDMTDTVTVIWEII